MIKIQKILVMDDTNNSINALFFTWTAKKPEIPGFYFYKFPNSDDITIISIVFDEDDPPLTGKYVFFPGIEDFKLLSVLEGTFYGPLPLP